MKDKRAMPGNLLKGNELLGIKGRNIGQEINFSFSVFQNFILRGKGREFVVPLHLLKMMRYLVTEPRSLKFPYY